MGILALNLLRTRDECNTFFGAGLSSVYQTRTVTGDETGVGKRLEQLINNIFKVVYLACTEKIPDNEISLIFVH